MTVQKMQAAVQKTRIKQITQPRYSSHNRRTEPDTPPQSRQFIAQAARLSSRAAFVCRYNDRTELGGWS